MTRFTALLAAAALLFAACGSDDDTTTGSPTTVGETTTTTTTTTSDPTVTIPDMTTCTNAEAGYTLDHPSDWSTNDGSVTAACSAFDPGDVALEPATEAGTAIFVSLNDIAFETAADPDTYERIQTFERATVDGHDAVVVRHEVYDGLGDPGSVAHLWVVDVDGDALTASTRGPASVIDEWSSVLDSMMDTLTFTDTSAERPTEDGQAIGTANSLRVVAIVDGRELCVRPTIGNDVACHDVDSTRTIEVHDLTAPDGSLVAHAGTTSDDVTRVIGGYERHAAEQVRTTPIDGTNRRGFVLPLRGEALELVVGYDSSGSMLSSVDPTGSPAGVLAGVDTRPEDVDGGDDTAFLENVIVGRHAGYDRVSFVFGDHTPGYEVDYHDRPIVQDGSGQEVEVSGDAVIVVRMDPASGHETTGDAAPTYEGPTRITPSGFSIVELVQIGDFEGQVAWAVGVRGDLPFRAVDVDDTLVLDVRHRNA